jgi:integrase
VRPAGLHREFRGWKRRVFASKLFGRAAVDPAVDRLCGELLRWGYGTVRIRRRVPGPLCDLLLVNGSPRLEDLTPAVLLAARTGVRSLECRHTLSVVARGLTALGVMPAIRLKPDARFGTSAARADVPADWAAWAERWYRTSTLAPKTRESVFYALLKAGRWLAAHHPEATTPDRWTRDLAIEYVAAVDRMRVGDFAHPPYTHRYAARVGAPLAPRGKDRDIGSLRGFFLDCQEWGWLPRRFNPARGFVTPRSVRALIGPDPRVIADDVWAKLLWAGLNLAQDDLPKRAAPGFAPWYPLALVRAVAVTWLFAGLRNGELVRLRVGCVRWQRDDAAVPGTDDVLPRDAVCLLDVPAHKTGGAFTKPVDRAVGDAVAV